MEGKSPRARHSYDTVRGGRVVALAPHRGRAPRPAAPTTPSSKTPDDGHKGNIAVASNDEVCKDPVVEDARRES
jgi:hypothetical protein